MSLEDPDVADTAAAAVLKDLNGRKGYDDLWGEIPPDIRDEILVDLASVIRGVYEAAP